MEMSLSEVQTYTWVISLASLGMVFVGWRVVYRNAKKIATRSESKAITDHLIKLINEIIDLSVTYWMEDEGKTNSSLRYNLAVSAKTTQIDDFITILGKRDIIVDREYLACFTTVATLDSEQKGSLDIELRSEKCQGCVDEGMRLISHIYHSFEKRHPPQKLTKLVGVSYYLQHFDSHCNGCARPYIEIEKNQ
jgi:hypothetical protein